MKKAVMAVILIMVLAFSVTAFADEVKILKVFDKSKQSVNGKKYISPYAFLLCVDGYVFMSMAGGNSATYFESTQLVQFLEKGPNGTSAPKTCDMSK